jgi:ankyrin repeat protein
MAISNGQDAAAELLLDRGANFMLKMQGMATALNYAASRGHSTMLRLLLDRGADPNAGNLKGATATEKGREDAVRLLFNRGFDVHAKANRRLEISGAKAKNCNQVAPLHLAAENGHPAVVSFSVTGLT